MICITNINKIDIVQAGFPCQAFSYAGNNRGFEDTRGTLFFEFARCVKECKPKIAVGENVKGLLRHDNGRTFTTMLNVLSEIGWRVEMARKIFSKTKPMITKETARNGQHTCNYSNQKIKTVLGIEFIPVKDAVKNVCDIFLKESKSKTASLRG